MQYPIDFLQQLDNQQNKITYARIIALTFDERPLETIEGRITSGSLNLDGNSAIRRTCQLSLVTPQVNLSNYYWGLNTKFKLSIGVENYIDSKYPEIIWFEQGVYIITSFNASYNTSSYTINLSGKDKMCLLNGEVGGSISSSVDFGVMEQEKTGVGFQKIKLPVKDIIREMVHAYAGEPFHNILVNDLEDKGLILQEYRYDTPMYLLRPKDGNTYTQGFINGDQTVTFNGSSTKLSKLEGKGFQFDNLATEFVENASKPSIVEWHSKLYHVAKINYGETVGYTETDLVYPADLIANIGESITSVLDKIKNFLGEFEYFYNLQGQFVFQKKKTYVQTDWSPIVNTEDGEAYVQDLKAANNIAYYFSGSKFFTSLSNAPNLLNLKNDFTVWGTKGTSQLPIHMRYAIDTKPIMYKTIEVDSTELEAYNKQHGLSLTGQKSHLFIVDEKYAPKKEQEPTPAMFKAPRYSLVARTRQGNIYYDSELQVLKLQVSGTVSDGILHLATTGNYDPDTHVLTINSKEYTVCDWRELIYRMALDYNKYNHLDNFQQRIIAANFDLGLYQAGRTGYEQYYVDMSGFWRQLYNPYDWNRKYRYAELGDLDAEIQSISKDMKDALEKDKNADVSGHREKIQELNKQREWLLTYYDDTSREKFGWARNIYEHPDQLLFWFDFLDVDGELNQFSIPAVGDRPKVVNDKDVKAIYYMETPNVIFQSNTASPGDKTGYKYFNYPSGLSMFKKSSRGKSAKEAIDTLLYNHSYCVESVSITSIPIYYLDTNIRIYINDVDAGIEGEYIVSKISMPLTYNGTMNITATKAAQRLL